ncbi:hypothetical protein PAXINDRAFT_158499 [Paxillus involutus ATCC 200175]|uniref:Secreted protein n=1 Tax=Paxillus involutus ATCC 200175 TaxID=664439 RepID=A0A0C9SN30_PAXIN|nr:hypothetical protein PAXINDRAFT_158499 [Paxillus involutus ATCC 200175]
MAQHFHFALRALAYVAISLCPCFRQVIVTSPGVNGAVRLLVNILGWNESLSLLSSRFCNILEAFHSRLHIVARQTQQNGVASVDASVDSLHLISLRLILPRYLARSPTQAHRAKFSIPPFILVFGKATSTGVHSPSCASYHRHTGPLKDVTLSASVLNTATYCLARPPKQSPDPSFGVFYWETSLVHLAGILIPGCRSSSRPPQHWKMLIVSQDRLIGGLTQTVSEGARTRSPARFMVDAARTETGATLPQYKSTTEAMSTSHSPHSMQTWHSRKGSTSFPAISVPPTTVVAIMVHPESLHCLAQSRFGYLPPIRIASRRACPEEDTGDLTAVWAQEWPAPSIGGRPCRNNGRRKFLVVSRRMNLPLKQA